MLPAVYTPSTVLAIASAFLILGLLIGFGLCALLTAGSIADDAMEHDEMMLRMRHPVCWRYRPVASGRWIYSEDYSEVGLVPAHWQCQSLGLIANMFDLDAPYTGVPSTNKEPA